MSRWPAGRRALAGSISGTTASVFPAFLTGAVAVQLTSDLGMGDHELGLVVGAFFIGAALASSTLGRAAERLGASRAMQLGMVVTATAGVLLATVASSPVRLATLLLAAGTSNALTQPAANLLITERLPHGRHGFAFALKQSGMPLASLLGGLAVPALAITLGWRSAYLAGALLAILSFLMIPAALPGERRRKRGTGADSVPTCAEGAVPLVESRPLPLRNVPDLPLRMLWLYSLAGLLGTAAAGATVSFLVSAAEASGMTPAGAGLLLTGGSLIGVISRLLHGRWADGPRCQPVRRVVVLLVLGSLGLMVMALDTPMTYFIGVVPMFAFGWAWPGLFNLSVVRNNPSAPAAATGITQIGIYVGAGAGPALGGLVAERAGYAALWLMGAGSLIAAALASLLLRVMLGRQRKAFASDHDL